MKKSEMIRHLAAEHPDITSDEAHRIFDLVFEEISAQLSQGKRVELRGFGALSTRTRNARKARNPRTNEVVELAQRKALYFRAGKLLLERINNA